MKKQIAIVAILLLGIAVSVFLAQRQQIFKSRADINVSSGLNITGSQGESVTCQGQECETEANEVIIQVTDPNVFLQD